MELQRKKEEPSTKGQFLKNLTMSIVGCWGIYLDGI